MTDEYSTSGEADWGWVRWQRIRWEMVQALENASRHPEAIPKVVCTSDCCQQFLDLVPTLGVQIEGSPSDWPRLVYPEHLESLVTNSMRDGLMVLSDFYSFQLLAADDPLAGYLEVPQAVGKLMWSQYFEPLSRPSELSNIAYRNLVREFVYALTTLAFPDEWFTALVPPARGRDAHREFIDYMQEEGLVVPDLDAAVVEHLQSTGCGYGTPPFGDEWDPIAPYGLEFARDGISLAEYWDFWPSVEHIFGFAARGNEGGTGVGLIARNSQNLFVSQQVWLAEKGGSEWNACTHAFNAHLAPLVARGCEGSPAIVVFSTYRHSAYIVSPDPDSWDEYAPASAVLGPLPHGWGIVGVWDNYDKARYTPRSLDSVINADYSEAITASARYLQECLLATERG